MLNMCTTCNYRSFSSFLTKFRFLQNSLRFLKTVAKYQSTSNRRLNKLPSEIEQNIQRWEQASELEYSKVEEFPWIGVFLKCTKFLQSIDVYRIAFSTELLSQSQLTYMRSSIYPPVRVQLKFLDSNNCDIIPCVLTKWFGNNIVVHADEETAFNLINIEGKFFDIRLDNKQQLRNKLKLFENRRELIKSEGYNAMLYCFKCKEMDDFGVDPDINKFLPLYKNYDQSQLAALSALLNTKRPIVAIHGASGTGKTLLLAEYLNILMKSYENQNKPIAIISPSITSLYQLIDVYFDIAREKVATFIFFTEYDSPSAYFSIKNSTVKERLKKASLYRIPDDWYSQEVTDAFDKINKLVQPKASSRSIIQRIQQREDGKQQREYAINLRNKEDFNFIQRWPLVFLCYTKAMMEYFSKIRAKFSQIIIDDAGNLNEMGSWHSILKTSSCVRLFGDYHQSNSPLIFDYEKSLLQRLDEDFVNSNINFHLNRQYTSNSTIRKWGDSVFYKEKKAIPANKFIENTNLKKILRPKKHRSSKLITEPFVLVDTNKLEGEWKEYMFEPENVEEDFNRHNCYTFRNWGSALIAARHINLLLQNGVFPYQIAHPKNNFLHLTLFKEIYG
uniref:AAA domain-containing protein n=1 Tax=Meloidogyne hapla TaxID=6305 RepID=A0A1I8BN07_MELHA